MPRNPPYGEAIARDPLGIKKAFCAEIVSLSYSVDVAKR